MFSGMCDEVGRGDISHKCCNVDIVKGSVKHIMFGHGMGCANYVSARGASYYDVEPMAMYVLGNLHVVLCQMMLECH